MRPAARSTASTVERGVGVSTDQTMKGMMDAHLARRISSEAFRLG